MTVDRYAYYDPKPTPLTRAVRDELARLGWTPQYNHPQGYLTNPFEDDVWVEITDDAECPVVVKYRAWVLVNKYAVWDRKELVEGVSGRIPATAPRDEAVIAVRVAVGRREKHDPPGGPPSDVTSVWRVLLWSAICLVGLALLIWIAVLIDPNPGPVDPLP